MTVVRSSCDFSRIIKIDRGSADCTESKKLYIYIYTHVLAVNVVIVKRMRIFVRYTRITKNLRNQYCIKSIYRGWFARFFDSIRPISSNRMYKYAWKAANDDAHVDRDWNRNRRDVPKKNTTYIQCYAMLVL